MPIADRDSLNYHDDVGYDDSDQPTCQECGKVVVWDHVLEEFDWIFNQSDFYGYDSLTENEQVVACAGAICSMKCFEAMEAADHEYWQRQHELQPA